MNEPTPSTDTPALKLLRMLSADYDHPWPNEDGDTREHRERRLSQMNELLTIAASGTPAPSLLAEAITALDNLLNTSAVITPHGANYKDDFVDLQVRGDYYEAAYKVLGKHPQPE